MTKKEPKEKRIEAIVSAAVDVFLEKGYENASMDAIAGKTGLSKGGLYHHFTSKDEILLYANQKLCEPIYSLMEQAVADPSPRQGVTDYINTYIDYWHAHKREIIFTYLSMTKAMNNQELRCFYETYLEHYIDFFEGMFKKGIAAGEFVDHEPRPRSVILIAALDGLVGYMDLDKKLDVTQLKKMLIETFVLPIEKPLSPSGVKGNLKP